MRKVIRARYVVYAQTIVDINIPDNLLELPNTGNIIKSAKEGLVRELERHVAGLKRIEPSSVQFEELHIPELEEVKRT